MKKDKKDKKAQAVEIEKKRVQDLINVQDIKGGILYTKDGYLQGYIRVLPVNISLLSKAEKRRKKDLIKEKINTEEEYEFLKIAKSVDLSQQVNYLQDLAKEETNHIKKMGLLECIRATSKYTQQGEMVENQYYFMFRKKNSDSHSVKELQDKLFEFTNKMSDCEIKSYTLEDMEIIQIANLFCNPIAYAEDMLSFEDNISTFLNE